MILDRDPGLRADEETAAGRARPADRRFPAGQARITRYDPRRVEVAVAPNEPGFLVLSDSHYPGWRVAVDGEERAMLLANHVFRAVALGPADREVVFSFEPASFRIGASVSIAALLLWAGLTFGGRGRAPWSEGEVPEGRRILSSTLQLLLILLLHAAIRQWPLWAGMLDRCRAPAAWF